MKKTAICLLAILSAGCALAQITPKTPLPDKGTKTDTPAQILPHESLWEDPDGFVGRYAAADGSYWVDVAVEYWKHAFFGKFYRAGATDSPVGLVAEKAADPDSLLLRGPDVSAEVKNGILTLSAPGIDQVQLNRVPVGKTAYNPPAGATILVGKDTGLSHFQSKDGSPSRWEVLEDGVIGWIPGAGNLYTKDNYEDAVLYFEFRVPYNARHAGNSGAYMQGAYEVQVIDSFGWDLEPNMCGTLYRIAKPLKNMAAPSLEWQSMKIDFTAPRYDADGKKIADARASVWHNGELVADNTAIPHHTIKPTMAEPKGPQPIHFQDHKSGVQYRNMWILPKQANAQ